MTIFAIVIASLGFGGCSAKANSHFIEGVATDCASANSGRARGLGLHYPGLSSADVRTATDFANRALAGDDSVTGTINAQHLNPPIANGLQFRRHFHQSPSQFRRSLGVCHWDRLQSLGTQDGTTFALMDVTCPSAAPPWNKSRLALEITDGKVANFCLNVGAPAMIEVAAREGR